MGEREGEKGDGEREKNKIQDTLAIGYIKYEVSLHLLIVYYFIETLQMTEKRPSYVVHYCRNGVSAILKV